VTGRVLRIQAGTRPLQSNAVRSDRTRIDAMTMPIE